MAITATTAYRVVASMRINKISVWAVPFTSTAASQGVTTVGIEFNNVGSLSTFGSPNKRASDTSMSPAQYAYVTLAPDPHSLSGSWFNDDCSTSQPCFAITAPIGSIVDISFDVVLRDQEAATPISRAIVGGTIGQLYQATLLPTVGTSLLQPLSYATL